VRIAAVDALCLLSLRSPSIAARAAEHLLDMMNDEAAAVCLNAAHSLARSSPLMPAPQ
jgi:hypothetical protein